MKDFFNDVSLQFTQFKANVEELLSNIQNSYLFLKNIAESVHSVLNWFGFSAVVVLLLAFVFFRIFNFIYPYNKLLNLVVALLSVFTLWLFFNIHFYDGCSLASFASLQNCHLTGIFKTFLFLFSILFFLWFLQFLLEQVFSFFYRLITGKSLIQTRKLFFWQRQKISQKDANEFFHVLDKKNWELKEQYRLGNIQQSKKTSQEIQDLLKDYWHSK